MKGRARPVQTFGNTMDKKQLLETVLRSNDPCKALHELVIHKRKRRTKPKNRTMSRAAKKASKSPSTKRARSKALKKFYKSSAGKRLAKARGRFVAKLR